MMRNRLLTWFLGLTLLAVTAGIAAAQAPYAAPTVANVGSSFSDGGLKIGTGLFRITLAITAGANGSPAGFTVEWMKKSDFDANGGWADMGLPTLKYCTCSAPFVLNQWAGSPIMAAGQTTYLQIGDLGDESTASIYGNDYDQLTPGTTYVVRAFTEADGNGDVSLPSSTVTVTTTSSECTQGFWKTHGPGACHSGNNADTWPAACFPMLLGTVSYNQTQICSILNENTGGNGLISLAHQLITTKLNGCSTSDLTPVAATIVAADALIGGLVVPPVGSGFLSPGSTSSLTETLDDYNNGLLGGVANCPTPVRANTTWGRVKVLYR